MSGGQTPGQEQEVLVSAIETSAISHKSADRIYISMAFRRGTRPPLWVQQARRHIITDATAGRHHLENNATGDDYSHWCRYCQPHYHHQRRRSAQSAGDSTGHLCDDVCACRSFIPVSAIPSCVHIGLVCFTPITASRETCGEIA